MQPSFGHRLKVLTEKSRLYHTDVIERAVLNGSLAWLGLTRRWYAAGVLSGTGRAGIVPNRY